uniref:Uncharacterized protein n=1 Tax=Anguilla anguilla TaxID=7936 RepID=A0A0E9XZD9_ANGAN
MSSFKSTINYLIRVV